MIIIGVDPGKNGGICLLNSKTKSITVRKMPETPMDLLSVFRAYSKIPDIVCIKEKLHGMPRMSGTAMFSFGKGYGEIGMALLAVKIKTIEVTAQKWQKHFQLGTKSDCANDTIWKNKLKSKAQQLFPKNEIFLWGADAILIAEYARANNID